MKGPGEVRLWKPCGAYIQAASQALRVRFYISENVLRLDEAYVNRDGTQKSRFMLVHGAQVIANPEVLDVLAKTVESWRRLAAPDVEEQNEDEQQPGDTTDDGDESGQGTDTIDAGPENGTVYQTEGRLDDE